MLKKQQIIITILTVTLLGASFLVIHKEAQGILTNTEKKVSSFGAIMRLKQLNTTRPKTAAKVASATDFCLKVPIIYYHHIQPQAQALKLYQTKLTVDNKIFEDQIKYLKENGYNFLTAEQLVQDLIQKREPAPKSIVITLDDGYEDAFTYAYPIAQKYNAILNLMIPTGLIGKPDYLTWDQLKEMQGSGLVFIYNHTVSHYPLALGTRNKVKQEILGARKDLNEHLGIISDILTYPYGNYDHWVVNDLKENGFLAAFSTHKGINQCQSEIYALRRFGLGNISLQNYKFQ